jgi:hypothetical protein
MNKREQELYNESMGVVYPWTEEAARGYVARGMRDDPYPHWYRTEDGRLFEWTTRDHGWARNGIVTGAGFDARSHRLDRTEYEWLERCMPDPANRTTRIPEAEARRLIAEVRGKQEPALNADGDSIEDMRKVWDAGHAIDVCINPNNDTWQTHTKADRPSAVFKIGPMYSIMDYRLTAKHSDVFDQKCMCFETWARAAIGRGMVVRGEGRMKIHDSDGHRHEDCILWADKILGGELVGPDSRGSSGHYWGFNYGPQKWAWTAIPRAQYEQATAKVRCFETVYFQRGSTDGRDYALLRFGDSQERAKLWYCDGTSEEEWIIDIETCQRCIETCQRCNVYHDIPASQLDAKVAELKARNEPTFTAAANMVLKHGNRYCLIGHGEGGHSHNIAQEIAGALNLLHCGTVEE